MHRLFWGLATKSHSCSAPAAADRKTHYSPTDPDARISIKPGKARKLNYHCSLAVDTAEGVISHVQADFADGRDSRCLPGITLKLQQRLADNELRLEEILADTAGAPVRLFQRK